MAGSSSNSSCSARVSEDFGRSRSVSLEDERRLLSRLRPIAARLCWLPVLERPRDELVLRLRDELPLRELPRLPAALRLLLLPLAVLPPPRVPRPRDPVELLVDPALRDRGRPPLDDRDRFLAAI